MRYPGGKSAAGVYHKIISLMPPHEVYIEPFYGGGSIMRLKRPAKLNIGIDRDRAAVEKAGPPEESHDMTVTDPHARESERRRRSASVSASEAFSAETREPAAPLNRIVETGESHFAFYQEDGIAYLEWMARNEQTLRAIGAKPTKALIYCDPPYMRETCKSRCRYKYDLSDLEHRRLLRVLQDLNALPDPPMLMISGYDSPLYREAFDATAYDHAAGMWRPQNWTHQTFQAMTRAGKQATEHLWFNFLPPVELHDYRYQGKNWRDRERMKRRQVTWTNRLRKMAPYEREALLNAIRETPGP